MQRRHFLATTLAALFGPGLASTRVAAAAPTPPERTQTPMLLLRSTLARFQYHQRPAFWPHLRAGQDLTLIREHDNPHDARAVRISWQDEKLRYLPCLDNAAVPQRIDRDQRLSARIASIFEYAAPWRQIGVEINIPPA